MAIEINVRRAAINDVDFLVSGNAAMALETERRVLDATRMQAGVRALFEDPSRGVYYIAEAAREPAGQMLITYEWSDWRNANFWWIQSVYVLPRLRGQSVFRSLYTHVEQLARGDPKVCGLRLYVEHLNTRAQAAYEKCGLKRADYQMFEVDFVPGTRK